MKAKAGAYWKYSTGLLLYKPLVTLADVAFNVMIFGHGTALSFLARQVLNQLDAGAQGQATRRVMVFLAAILAVSLIRVGAIMACATLDAMRGYYYQNRTRLGLLRRIFARPDACAVAGGAGSVFEVLDDDVPAATFPAELLTEALGYCLCTLGTLAILLAISWQITLLVFLPLSMAIYGLQRLSGSMRERRRVSRDAHDTVSAFLSDVADSVLTIKAAGAEADILRAFDLRNAARREAVLRDAAFGARLNALLFASAHVGTAIMMCAFALMRAGGDFRAGDFSLFVASLFTLSDSVNRIAELFAEYRKGEVSHERIQHAAQSEAALPAEVGLTLLRADDYLPVRGEAPPRGELAVSGLSYAREGAGGVRDVSFRLLPGQLLAVAGCVGAGKSTLLHLLAGVLAPDAGEMRLGGEALGHGPPSISYAPQRPRFFSTDVQDNLKMGRALERGAIGQALSRAALTDVFPDTTLGSRGTTLSGGQRQRLCLARMYAHDARVLLIDDCVSALDEATQAAVLCNLLEAVRAGRMAVIATNQRSFLKAADAVLVMRDGRAVAQGTYEEVMEGAYLRSIVG